MNRNWTWECSLFLFCLNCKTWRFCNGVGLFWRGEVRRFDSSKGIMKKKQKKNNQYHSILQRHAIPSSLRIIGPNFTFQQDNDPKHSSKLYKYFSQSKQTQQIWKIMIWPPQSPDLAPNELASNELGRKVRQEGPTNEKDLSFERDMGGQSGSYCRGGARVYRAREQSPIFAPPKCLWPLHQFRRPL